MKILFHDFTLPQLLRDAEYPVGGFAVQLRELLIGLSQAGHRSGVLTWKGANAYVGKQNVCDMVETYDKTKGIRKLRFFYSWMPAMIAATRSYRPDIILQSCSGVDTALNAFVAAVLGIPFVHRIAVDTDTDGRYVQYLDSRGRVGFRYGMRRASFVICQNEYQLAHIRQNYPGKPAGILHNAISIPTPLPPLKSRAERRYVAWMGVFRKQKNLAALIDIAARLPEIEFQVAGMLPPTPDSRTVEAVARLKQFPNVKFAGYVRREGVHDFLANAIALVSTSDFEGFSNAFLESLLMGTPIAGRITTDPDAIIARNRLGLSAGDDMQLAGNLREIYRLDAEAYEAMSRRCRDHVEANHSPANAVRKLVAMLEPVAHARRRRA